MKAAYVAQWARRDNRQRAARLGPDRNLYSHQYTNEALPANAERALSACFITSISMLLKGLQATKLRYKPSVLEREKAITQVIKQFLNDSVIGARGVPLKITFSTRATQQLVPLPDPISTPTHPENCA